MTSRKFVGTLMLVLAVVVASAKLEMTRESVRFSHRDSGRVDVELETMVERDIGESSTAMTPQYHQFPVFFDELSRPYETLGYGDMWSMSSFVLEACGGRVRPVWCKYDTSPAPCRGQTLSVCFLNPKDTHRPRASSSCPSWKRTVNVLSAKFGNTFTQFHPGQCNVSFDGLKSSTVQPIHHRNLFIQAAADDRGEEQCYYGNAPTEPFCVEHLAPILGMLPDQLRGKGKDVANLPNGIWATFLPSYQELFDAEHYRMVVNVTRQQSQMRFNLKMHFTVVASTYLKFFASKRPWQVKPTSKAPVAEAASLTLVGATTEELQLPLPTSTLVDKLRNYLSPIENVKPTQHDWHAKYAHCGSMKNFQIRQNGEIDGVIEGDIIIPEGAVGETVMVLLRIPLHICRPLLHTLAGDNDNLMIFVVSVQWDEKPNTASIQLRVSRPWPQLDGQDDGGILHFSMRYQVPFLPVVHYPPDGNKAYWIPSATLVYSPSSGKCACQDHPHKKVLSAIFRNSSSIFAERPNQKVGKLCFESSMDATVLSLPIADVAMPFNALALACAVYAALYGFIFSMTARNQLSM